MTAGREDRRSTRGRPAGAPVVLIRKGADFEPDFMAVTSASVVAVTSDDRLVLALLDRGPDLPGGHVRQDETSVEDTVRREAWEEVRAHLGPISRVDVLESDYYGPDDITYMVICAARVTGLAAWEAGFESAGRVVMEPAEFLARYRGGDPGIMRSLVSAALAVLGPGDRRTVVS